MLLEIAFRFFGVIDAGRPRFPAVYPGYQPWPALSTRWKNCRTASLLGCAPPSTNTCLDIQSYCASSLPISCKTCHSAQSLHCSLGDSRPSAATVQMSRSNMAHRCCGEKRQWGHTFGPTSQTCRNIARGHNLSRCTNHAQSSRKPQIHVQTSTRGAPRATASERVDEQKHMGCKILEKGAVVLRSRQSLPHKSVSHLFNFKKRQLVR